MLLKVICNLVAVTFMLVSIGYLCLSLYFLEGGNSKLANILLEKWYCVFIIALSVDIILGIYLHQSGNFLK